MEHFHHSLVLHLADDEFVLRVGHLFSLCVYLSGGGEEPVQRAWPRAREGAGRRHGYLAVGHAQPGYTRCVLEQCRCVRFIGACARACGWLCMCVHVHCCVRFFLVLGINASLLAKSLIDFIHLNFVYPNLRQQSYVLTCRTHYRGTESGHCPGRTVHAYVLTCHTHYRGTESGHYPGLTAHADFSQMALTRFEPGTSWFGVIHLTNWASSAPKFVS